MHAPQPPAAGAGHESGPAPGSAAPRTPTEALVAEVWCELLELDAVDLSEGFFEVGGHSMVAVQVVYEIERRTGIPLDLESFFDLSTVTDVAAELDRLRSAGAGQDAGGIEEGEL